MIQYPITDQADVNEEHFGKVIGDPYRWMEDEADPRLPEWIAAQRALTADYMNELLERPAIAQRLRELYRYDAYADIKVIGDNIVYSCNDGSTNQPIYYIQRGLTAQPQQLIDPNQLSAAGTVAIMLADASSDHRLLAYMQSEAGSDWQQIRVLDIESGERLADTIKWVKFTRVAWRGEGFYYSGYSAPANEKVLTNQNSEMKVYYHQLGTDQADDVLVYQDPTQPLCYHNLAISEDRQHLVLATLTGTYGAEIKLKTASDADFTTLFAGYANDYNFLGKSGDELFFYTDKDADLGKVIAYHVKTRQLHDVIVADKAPLSWAKLIDGRLIAHYEDCVVSLVKVYTTTGEYCYQLALPGLGTVDAIAGNEAFDSYVIKYSSFTQPSTLYAVDKQTGALTTFKSATPAYDAAAFQTTQLFITSKDGTEVPVFVTHKKELVRNGQNPTLLYGYGGFNVTLPASFDPALIYLLEQGGIFAQVNLRGGAEFGEAWHRAGMLLNKQNVFDDFISAAEQLMALGYTSREYLAIKGRSNGGLLIGAVLNQRPDLAAVAFPQVGVMDMLRYHTFTVGWGWMVEYGNPEQREHFDNLYGYSPLHNIQAVDYPATMVMTADHDDRVVPAHSFKYAATLQQKNTSACPMLIRIAEQAGHGVGRSTEQLIDENADVFAFMFHHMGSNYREEEDL